MRPLGNPYAATSVGDDHVFHAWLLFNAESTCLNAFHAAETVIERDAQRYGAVVTGPVFYETFRPVDPGVPREVRAAFHGPALESAVGVVHAFATVERRNAVRAGREASSAAP